MSPSVLEARGASSSRVVVFTHFFPPAVKGGGPLRTVDALIRTAPSDFEISVITSDRDLGERGRLPVRRNTWVRSGSRRVFFASSDRLFLFLALVRRAAATTPELVYVNSFFDPLFGLLPLFTTRRSQLLVAPRGEFGVAALASKSAKKRLVMALFRLTGRHRRIIWHASSDRERRDIARCWGPAARTVVRENETRLPARAYRVSVPVQSAPAETSRLSVAVVGRIVPTKGLDLLLRGAARVTRHLDLHVYGNREDEAYASRCDELASRLPSHVTVHFHGSLDHSTLQKRLVEHDAMATATLGENFGHVIAESLAAGVPVVMADVSPWTPRLLAGGGVVVPDNTVEAWSAVLEGLAGETEDERLARRDGAADVYDAWRRGPAPEHVFTMASRLARQSSVT